MIQKELIATHVPGLEFEPLTELLAFFTSGSSVMQSFAIPDGSFDDLAAEFPLHDCPELVKEQLNEAIDEEARLAVLLAGHVGLGELAAGTGALSHAGEKLGVPLSSTSSGTSRNSSFWRHSIPTQCTSAMASWAERTRSGCSRACSLASSAVARPACSRRARGASADWRTTARARPFRLQASSPTCTTRPFDATAVVVGTLLRFLISKLAPRRS